jgi:hypothetical protein
MKTVFNESALGKRRASSWLVSEFAAEEKRMDLIQRYNDVAGHPGAAVKQVQDEFVGNRMEPDEAVAFIAVCMSLITAATGRTRMPRA